MPSLYINGLYLYSAFIQSAVQLMPFIHPFTHQWWLAAMQGTNQLIRSNWGFGVMLRDTSTHPGRDRTGNPSDCQTTGLTSLAIPPSIHVTHCEDMREKKQLHFVKWIKNDSCLHRWVKVISCQLKYYYYYYACGNWVFSVKCGLE